MFISVPRIPGFNSRGLHGNQLRLPVTSYQTTYFWRINEVLLDGSVATGHVWRFTTVGPPVADFQAFPVNGIAPLVVSFRDTSTGIINSWSWNFGEGGTSTEQNPVHMYRTAGIYSVSLTASGAYGSDTITRNGLITVKPAGSGSTPGEKSGADCSGVGLFRTCWFRGVQGK